MSLINEFKTAVFACQPAIFVHTDEIEDAISTLTRVCNKRHWDLKIWDAHKGLNGKKADNDSDPVALMANRNGNVESPVELINDMIKAGPVYDRFNTTTITEDPAEQPLLPSILVLKNGHLSLAADRHRLSAAIQNFAPVGKEFQKTIVVISPPGTKLPEEVAPLFHKINHNLPDEVELAEIYDTTLGNVDAGDSDKKKSAVKAALGMTRLQAEGVFAASFVEHKEVRASSVWKYKADILNQDGLVALLDTNLKYADVGGNEGVKEFLKRLLTPNPLSDQDKDVRAKGVVLVGPPGTGKSLIAQTTGNEFGIPTLLANPGNLMGGLVGETEKNTRKFFDICKAMAPCVVIIDEVSKVMPAAGGDHDGGVGSRMLGTFLTQMNDIKEQIFWVFTENDISNMHEAFTRAERVDAIFYVRLPDDKQRAEIWRLYLNRFFPATINGKDNPRKFQANAQSLLDEYLFLKKEKTDKSKDITYFARKIAVSLLAEDQKYRNDFLAKVAKIDDVLERAIKAFSVNDEGWTPAEIRSACRLSCLLNEDLHETQLRIRPVCVSAARQIRKLDKWASESALDASTGKLFRLVDSTPDTSVPVQTTGKRRLRTDN